MAGQAVRSAARAKVAYMKGDEDIDGDPNGGYDDGLIREFGHPADGEQRRAISALVRSFYAGAVARNGGKACAMALPLLTRRANLVKTIPDSYIPLGGSAALRGKRCPAAMSRVFDENHATLVGESRTLTIVDVRVGGIRALALLGFRSDPERYLPLQLDAGAWKLAALLDEEIT